MSLVYVIVLLCLSSASVNSQRQMHLALDGQLKDEDTELASSTLCGSASLFFFSVLIPLFSLLFERLDSVFLLPSLVRFSSASLLFVLWVSDHRVSHAGVLGIIVSYDVKISLTVPLAR